jgi:vacuolar-type H+-ATPase subunit F/Vma7
MLAFAYVGDSVQAAGFRLIGAKCWVPEPGNERAEFLAARKEAEAVFISPAIAERLPRTELDAALAAGRPLLLLVPTPGTDPSPLDPAERVRAQLGLDR